VTASCLECADWPEQLEVARYAFVLAHPADHLVHALKYEGWRELAGFMGGCIADCVGHEAPRQGAASGMADQPCTLVVPMPTTDARVRSRGYNQAALLADEVGRRLGLDVRPVLTRRSGAASQTSLTPEQRRHNVRGVFEPVAGSARVVVGTHVVLVDDVLTTGATGAEAATGGLSRNS